MANEMEIKAFMAANIESGMSLSDLQKEVNSKFGTKYTFMEIRLLASELENIDWSQRDPVVQDVVPDVTKVPVPGAPGQAGQTVVELNKIVQPGMLASGTVKFASGVSGDWFVDENGRLGMGQVSGEPTPEDIKEFQDELKKLFSRG